MALRATLARITVEAKARHCTLRITAYYGSSLEKRDLALARWTSGLNHCTGCPWTLFSPPDQRPRPLHGSCHERSAHHVDLETGFSTRTREVALMGTASHELKQAKSRPSPRT